VKTNQLFRVFTRTSVQHPFQELVCAAIRLVDRLWIKHAKSYFDFPVIFAKVKEKLEACIGCNPASFEILCRFVTNELPDE